jgi:Leucine-rich repeat (LRR) protein
MEVISAIASKLVESMIAPVGQWLGYSFHYSSNIENVKKRELQLQGARERVQHSVDDAKRNAEEIEREVTTWLENVDVKMEEARKVLEDEEKARKRCSNGTCLNLMFRHRQSKKAKKIVQDIDEVLEKGRFDRVSYRLALQEMVTTTNMDYMPFKSRILTMKGIMEALRDVDISIIGVWGMPGVGKSTLVREIAKQAKEKRLFDEVAIATVKQNPKTQIQGEIADKLDLKLNKESLSGRADLLRARLNASDKKILVILDDIWEKVDLEALGIPCMVKTAVVREAAKQAQKQKSIDKAMAAMMQSPDPRQIKGEFMGILDLKFDGETEPEKAIPLHKKLTKDKKSDLDEKGISCNGCKIIVTSRNHDVVCKMGTQKDFELELLQHVEAWSLFEKIAGDSLKEPKFRSIATRVSEKCAGLPLALVTVAKALKDRELCEWEDALQQLSSPSPGQEIHTDIYSPIELSIDHLKSTELRSFFLLCGHEMGARLYYMDLLKYFFGLNLFFGINTLEQARKRLFSLVGRLKDSGLLLDGPPSSNFVLMHDLVRDVAKLIASKNEKVLTMRGDGPVEWPAEDEMKKCTRISIAGRDIQELSGTLECPELTFFHVHGTDQDCPFKISDTFFQETRKLKVLDLTYMRLSSLPSSLNLLTNLQTLCLDQCVLGDMTVIGELKNLEILSLLRSEFKQLPREIGHLTRLRLLDLSNCTKLEVIPPNILSHLIQLEELLVGNSFSQWEVEGASLNELKHLSQLTNLEVHIKHANLLPRDLSFKNLKTYKIFIGDVWDWSGNRANSRVLKLKLNRSFQSHGGIKMLLNGIEDLCLDALKGVKSVLYELDTEGFQQLKHLYVQNNAEIKYIIDSTIWVADVVFPSLEEFSLKNMTNLEEIYHGRLPSSSFHNLRVVRVEHCDKLKFVFPSSIARGLSQLQELEIRECSLMCAIVVKEKGEIEEIEDTDMILFPQLHHLALERLPKLMSFLSTQNSFIADAAEISPEGARDFHMPILQEQVH